jgi:hypothetical protein
MTLRSTARKCAGTSKPTPIITKPRMAQRKIKTERFIVNSPKVLQFARQLKPQT